MRRRLVAGAALLLALGVPTAAAAAQLQTFTLPASEEVPKDRWLVFNSDATAAAGRPGGFGWVSIEGFNPDTAGHDVVFAVVDPMQHGAAVATSRIRLEAGERSRVVLPVPHMEWMGELRIAVDDGPSASTQLINLSPGNTTTLPSLLALTDDAALGSALRSSVESWLPVMVDSGTLTGFAVKRVRDLPDRWQMLSGFDAIVLDLSSDGLSAERQQVLADFVAVGGRLVLAGSTGIAGGPLSSMLDAGAPAGASAAALGPGSRGRHGFGQWLVTAAGEHAFGSEVFEWLKQPEFVGMGRTFSGLPHDGLGSYLVIPGVGEVPKSAFLLLIITFVAAIVVLAVRLLRQRRHGRLLLVVPGTGLAFTGAILAYGFFSEGLGFKGVLRSVTLLDQRSHQAVDVAQRTLYAGLQPDELPLDAGTLLVSWDQFRGDSNDRVHRLRLDTTAGWVAGGEALPARLPTHVATVTVSRPRERLRLRRAGPERLEVVPDAGLRLNASTGSLVVRDFSGAWWVSVGDDALRPMGAEETHARLAESLEGFRGLKRSTATDAAERHSIHIAGMPYLNSTSDPVAEHAENELYSWLSTFTSDDAPPGTYVARVEADPCVDGLGLDVDWIEREHIVVGRLAEEDVLE